MSVFKTHNKSSFLNRNFSHVKKLSLNQKKKLLELALSKSLRNSYIKCFPLSIAINFGYEKDICENFESMSNTFIRNKQRMNNNIDVLIQIEESRIVAKIFKHSDEEFRKLKLKKPLT